MTVATPSSKSSRDSARVRKVRDLRGGKEALVRAAQKYLPKEPHEEQSDYASRLSRTWLLPALDETISGTVDRVFLRNVEPGEDMPSDLVGYSENITSDGRDLNSFAKTLFEDGLEAGLSFVLVDAPPNSAATVAEERAQRLRPYFVHVKSEDILGWKTSRVGSDVILDQVRIWEEIEVDDPKDEFATKTLEQVRVLTRENGQVRVQIYRRDDKDLSKRKWVSIAEEERFIALEEIPLVPFYAKRTGFFTGDPPFNTLADLNIAHWQSASDQRNILHFARVPILVFYGFEKDDVTLAANRAFFTSKGPSEARVEIVEHSGAAIDSGRTDLKDLEERMAVCGYQLLIPRPGNPTATGQAIEAARNSTPLADMAASLQDTLERAFGFMNLFRNQPAEEAGSVSINRDYGLSLLGGSDLEFLLKAVNTGQISRETFLKECMRRDVLMEGIVAEEEAEKIAAESLASQGTSAEDIVVE